MWSHFQPSTAKQFLAAQRFTSLLTAMPLLVAFIAACFPVQTYADTAINDRFELYINTICNTFPAPAGWNSTRVGLLCAAAFVDGFAGGGAGSVSTSSNLGTADIGNSGASPMSKEIHECLDDLIRKPGEKGCATGSWGLLLSTQLGRSIRTETELENGSQSDLKGLLIGFDYRFTGGLLLGAAAGQTLDTGTFINNAGLYKSSINTFTIYTTWLPSEKISLDAYLGNGEINIDSQRRILFGSQISGTANGSSTGRQFMAGLSTSYQSNIGRISISPVFKLDYIKTDIKGYNETGSTRLELRYGDRSNISSTASLGGRASYSFKYNWGILTPSINGAGVHEFQNNSNQYSYELVITPGTGFLVTTDSPDRDYFLSGLGLIAELNNKALVFLNYERRSGDNLLDAWTVSLGVLKEF